MIKSCNNIPHPLKREGTYQWQRFPEGISDGFFKPDNRSIEQIVEQVAEYATLVKYYDTTLNEWGRWNEFYDYLYDYKNKKLRISNIDSLLANGNVPPHLGLLLSFLKTYQTNRDDFNKFTNRHLDFYYEDVLQLQPQAAVPDNVAVLFQPEKNTASAKVETGRELDAGKDATGKNLVYTTTREIIVNQVSVSKIKTVFADIQSSQTKGLFIATDALSENKFTQNNISSWYPFGSTKNVAANIGFAISSPLLLAKEGKRRLSIEIDGGKNLPRTSLTAFYTAPKGWIKAEVDVAPGINNSSSETSKQFLLIKIDDALPAVIAYDEKIHQSGYACTYPVVKVLINNDSNFNTSINFLSGLKANSIKKIIMNVEGVKSFTITNDNGKLNPLQAFKPFGNIPVKNKSFFTIGNTEIFNKYLKTLHFATNWKGAPGNMGKYYSSYQTYLNTANDPSISKQVAVAFSNQWATFKPLNTSGKFDQGNLPGKLELLSGGQWVKAKEDAPEKYVKTGKEDFYNTFHTDNIIKDEFDITATNDFDESSKWGFAKVTLGYDFGHQFFPHVLTYNITYNATHPNAAQMAIPPQPYTPEFNSLHLDYVKDDTVDVVKKPEHQLLQLHPFGYSIIQSSQDTLVSTDYFSNGQLFIGIAGCTVPQIINLYISRLDGTEAIDAIINEKAEWYYLSGDEWIKFRFEEITINTSFDFTESGFISFAIPDAALLPNTLMGENLTWIKVVSSSSANAYPSIIDIFSNAVEAVFSDRGNDPYHLQSPLPAGSITKPVIKITGIKSVSQPSASYNGAMAEQSEHFYTRVSERLRHKKRSWNIWDYEHLVLEKFPSIYKLKCISHAVQDSMYAPGNILCVALPSTINIAEKDLLQPRISKGILTQAEEYINGFMTTFANIKFINPVYETITVKCSVKIKDGFDENYYSTQLNTELQQFLAPWILNKDISPSFTGKIYASSIINFIEERPYIDFITAFEVFKTNDTITTTGAEYITGSSEDVILTSVAQHQIDTNAIC
ncbi:MAG: baseplate J/gp47 family protein [Bacteroidetes bacterium]|nr:baseplate J/gp47 family protein [Bacteroidota bacterium]